VTSRRTQLALLAATALALATSCDVSDYCLNCATDDAGGGDGPTDANGDAPDGGGPADACVPTGVEICDGFDNDCNGETDDNLTDIGGTCGDADPPCTLGTFVCNAGVRSCTGVEPTQEMCDEIDNNCDGDVDENDPEGGSQCGSNEGECVAGVNHCVSGDVVCVGAIGMPGAVPEACNGQDDDCDGNFDEGIVLGTCGTTATGECELGELQCVGGGPVCVGAVGPTFELCDALDQDCDGNDTNGFDLTNDAQNCGGCGDACTVDHATAVCSDSECRVGACLPGFHDVNDDGQDPGGGDGCEYPCDFQSLQEACNGSDDDCDGDTDEGVVPPVNFCRQIGACMGAVAECTPTGWQCNYSSTVSTDGTGNIVPESTCDDVDNDCDGAIDESHPQKDAACNDGEQGACLDPGEFHCDTTDPTGPVVCDAVDDETTTGTETCNGIDDDCNGVVDDGHGTGTMTGQDFVAINGVNIMKYEASRPDATAGDQGTGTGWVCSRADAVPWTNVTRPQAQTACAAIGARLCTEAEWQSTCFATTQSFPIDGPSGANDRVFIEAEEGTISAAVAGKQFIAYTGTADYSGLGALQAMPNTGATVNCSATQEANAPRVDFNVNVLSAGNHYIWVRTVAPGGSNNDNSLCAGVDGTASTTTLFNTTNATWTWAVSPAFNVTAGTHRFSVYMREDATPLDAVVISKNGVDPPIEQSFAWAYNVNPSTPQPNKCNTDPYDTTAGGTDDDAILPTATLTACYANGGGANRAYDMTGNVREWTAPRATNINAIRGGASNTELNGASCQNDFVLGNDSFFFPNVGFRCCR
jgi:hypothetical protein